MRLITIITLAVAAISLSACAPKPAPMAAPMKSGYTK